MAELSITKGNEHPKERIPSWKHQVKKGIMKYDTLEQPSPQKVVPTCAGSGSLPLFQEDIETGYEHKTEQYGASFGTDYEVITQCTPDCPACVFKAGKQAGIQEVVKFINHLAIFTAEKAEEGQWYTYLGSYNLMWGTERLPSYGFKPFDKCVEWQAKLKEWGIKE